jgi:hypothetical protein
LNSDSRKRDKTLPYIIALPILTTVHESNASSSIHDGRSVLAQPTSPRRSTKK